MRDRDRERERDRGFNRAGVRGIDRDRDRDRDNARSRGADRDRDHAQDRFGDWQRDRDRDRGLGRDRDRPRESDGRREEPRKKTKKELVNAHLQKKFLPSGQRVLHVHPWELSSTDARCMQGRHVLGTMGAVSVHQKASSWSIHAAAL
jgi:hypothetical protein